MMKDAESHAEEDRKRKDEIETRNRADQAKYAAERLLKESGDKMDASDRQAIEAAVADLDKALSGGDAEAMAKAMLVANEVMIAFV